MPAVRNPKRTPLFRLLTIGSSGIGSFVLGLWGLKAAFGDGLAGMEAGTVVGIMAALCALAARRRPSPSSPASTSRPTMSSRKPISTS